MAQTKAEWRARRPQQTKLDRHRELAVWIQGQLEEEHSPEQISNRLKVEFPDQETMRVSHEVIYQELYVQGRGTLRADLHKRLRTGRAVRKPRRVLGERRALIPDMVNIAERPPEVDERTVPGHWEVSPRPFVWTATATRPPTTSSRKSPEAASPSKRLLKTETHHW